MFCEKCGGELCQEENKLVCTKCGAKYGTDYNDDIKFVQPVGVKKVPRGFSNKKHIIALAAAVAVMVAAAVVFIILNHFKPQNQTAATGGVEVAERFLWEQNYEQAVIEFEKILEIEPMNVEAYLGLADAYIGLGNTEKALEALRKGLELTGDPRLQDKMKANGSDVPQTSSTSTSSTNTSSSESSNQHPIESYPAEKIVFEYVDVSDYFDMSDTLSSIANGRIINATKINDYKPYKSIYLSEDMHVTELDEVFTSGIHCTEDHVFTGNNMPELVHNNGTQHVYKATSNGTEIIKTSPYPMYVTQDGYIAYYSSRSDYSVTVNIQSPSGDIVSSTIINGYIEPVRWIYGIFVDRLSISDSMFSFVDTKGAPFSYHLYTEQIQNNVTGYYDTKYVQYLFYKNGKVVLDEVMIEANVGLDYETPSCPESLSHSGKKYLRSYNVTFRDNNTEIVEYYDSNYTPVESIDGYYIEPKYAAYALVNKEDGVCSQLYKNISSANNGLYIATDFNGQRCYLDKKGHEVSIKYEDAGPFTGVYAFICENDTYYIIDNHFKEIMEINGTNVRSVGDNMFSCNRNQKLYLLSLNAEPCKCQ